MLHNLVLVHRRIRGHRAIKFQFLSYCSFEPPIFFPFGFHCFPILNGTEIRGKNSRYLFKFTGKDEEINLLGDGTEKAEFGEWSWISPEQVIELVSKPF